ncbi:unnamed protein product [Mucor circinelloides]|uniref:Uncharacterized protein n=1 Tax=Mucor circinelloides f. circinelloides (strain 1006PhL) TaxID=1220926 RepID=S2KGA6_MUCC1|nr:hypothetical protein HMPREF1544_01732 [Mucor circinelloides 1006PhL]KAG1111827.1 hypothetical protein G6F42_014913 [Rhizopus arrhizus]
MPRTPPPIILPSNLPSAWVNRSKVNKKKTNTSNIYATQNKQISFDDTDEYHFIPPFNRAESNAADSNEITSSILAVDEMQTRTMSASVSTNHGSFANTTQHEQQSHQEHHQQHQQQQQQHFQQRQQQHLSDQQSASCSSAKQNAPPAIPSSAHSHNRETNMSREQDQDVTMDELSNAFQHNKRTANDFLTPSSQQFESLIMGYLELANHHKWCTLTAFFIIVSQDLATDFQKFMEEYREIKKSIEDKKKELIQYTEERLHYLTQRQAHFQKELKSLQEFI